MSLASTSVSFTEHATVIYYGSWNGYNFGALTNYGAKEVKYYNGNNTYVKSASLWNSNPNDWLWAGWEQDRVCGYSNWTATVPTKNAYARTTGTIHCNEALSGNNTLETQISIIRVN